jgi:hypothetical protein
MSDQLTKNPTTATLDEMFGGLAQTEVLQRMANVLETFKTKVSPSARQSAEGSERFATALLLATPSVLNRAWIDGTVNDPDAGQLALDDVLARLDLSDAVRNATADFMTDNPELKPLFKSTAAKFLDVYTGDPCPNLRQAQQVVAGLKSWRQ